MFYQRLNRIFSGFFNTNYTRTRFIQTNFSFKNKNSYNKHEWRWPKQNLYLIATVAYLTYFYHDKKKYVHAKSCKRPEKPEETPPETPVPPPTTHNFPSIPDRPDLPTFTKADVSKHKCSEDRLWTTYQHGVYDITDFVIKHPGGDQIKLGAGKPIEPFWLVSPVHFMPHVLEEFEKYRIGNLRKEDVQTDFTKKQFYLNEPKDRDPNLILLTKEPFNAGASPETLYAHPITPNNYHFVRTHGPVPAIDLNNYTIEVIVEGKSKKLTLTLDELKKFPKHSVTAALMCAGTRRDEMMKVKPKKGLCWPLIAVGNSVWSGAKLSDILQKAGFTEEDTKVYNHVQFDALDTDYRGEHFAMLIPLWKAIDKRGEVIIAYEMNGSPIPGDHGFPVRAVVPGFAAARCVKWLNKITVQREECKTFNQQRLYKSFSPNVYYHNIDWNMSPAVDELPVISAICDPVEGGTAKVTDGHISVKGYAYSGGGQRIIRVDVSSDKGENWHTAEFTYQEDKKPPQHFSWSLWSCEVPVPKSKTCEIWVKAVDSCYNTQPEKFEHIWNLRGVICNAYHKININLS